MYTVPDSTIDIPVVIVINNIIAANTIIAIIRNNNKLLFIFILYSGSIGGTIVKLYTFVFQSWTKGHEWEGERL